MLGAFLVGMFVAGSVLSALQTDTTSAMQAKKVLNMAQDVSIGKKFVIDDISIANPDAVLYAFGCTDLPASLECSLTACTPDDMSVCVCEKLTAQELADPPEELQSIVAEGRTERLHGCETLSLRYPVRGFLRIQPSARIKVQQMEYENVASIVLEEVVT